MTKLPLCGFHVVRKPNKCYENPERSSPPSNVPRVGGVWYGGLHRCIWWDIMEDYYTHSLPDNLYAAYRNIREFHQESLLSYNLCRDIAITQQLLTYSNRKGPYNEITGVFSVLMSSYEGVFDFDSSRLIYLGTDVVCLGQWSLLRDGYFREPDAFIEWARYINEHGLFSPDVPVEPYINAYINAASRDIVEPLGEPIYGTDRVEVYRFVE